MFDTDQFEPKKFADKAANAASLMRSLSNEKRLMILCRLAAGERSVGDLGAKIDLSQSALSQHLALLREQGLVKTRREGQSIYYSIDDPAAIEVIRTLVSIYCPEMMT
ncbi:MAG: metalloregulator ArsR/SmtB family transcription factor [Aquisalinus sp.]|nr:metalloregulator ArsR/SmtB family transcription factor [Aquisalinus sp.]